MGRPRPFARESRLAREGLPKRYRKLFVPVADAVRIIVQDIRPADGSLFEALSRVAKQRFRAEVPAAEWADVDLPRPSPDAHGARRSPRQGGGGRAAISKPCGGSGRRRP